jgi:hypothetical protein
MMTTIRERIGIADESGTEPPALEVVYPEELKTTDQNCFSIQTLLIVLVPSWRRGVRPGPELRRPVPDVLMPERAHSETPHRRRSPMSVCSSALLFTPCAVHWTAYR